MAIVNHDVVLISSDDEDDDGELNFETAAVNPELVLISSDDEDDGERNLDEGVASEQEADYIELDDHESDKEEENDVEKLNVEECVDYGDRSELFNQGGNDLHALSLYECKTYLRKHGVRVSGTKEECIQRIEEHERLKDGKGESVYPKSSFSVNCTGDACRGDVVLFKQNMYNNQRNIIGRRTVAGRILKENYNALTQHTFSVEVLWSKRCKKLNPLSILQVKGYNLYQFGTYRQPWKSEAERSTVLEEKHERGKAARLKRKLRETNFGDNKGKKRLKVSHRVSSHSKHKHVDKNTNPELKRSTQLTYHSDPNNSMCSDHHLQEASLPFSYDRTLQLNNLPSCSSSGHSHHNDEQQGPNQALSQPPDHHHHASASLVNRSKDEKAKLHFPESSFSINCTGDARERDIVLFKKQVFLKGKNVEKRTVAGRIVKVRQCESRDKRKFVIKVLWTIPFINNLRRSTLLVRSRILYKFGTFRQPWKNEEMRSRMFEEKHRPATHKRELKKMDIALNKNKGAKHQKVFHKRPSPNKQPTQKANHKSSKRKDARATPVKRAKRGSNRTCVLLRELRKTKAKISKQQIFQLNPKPNTNLDPSLSTNLNLYPKTNPVSSTTLDPNPSLHLNPNQLTNPNTLQNQNSNSTDPNLNNSISSTTSNPNPGPHLNPNQHTNPNTHQNQNSNTCQNQNLNSTDPNLHLNSNSVSSTISNPNPSRHQKPNQHRKPKPNHPRQNLDPDPRQVPNQNPRQNPNPNPNTHQNQNSNTCQNQNLNSTDPNLHPNSNSVSSTISNPNPNPNTHQNQNSNTCQNQNLNSTDPNLHPNSNSVSSTISNPNPSPHQKPNQHTKPKPNHPRQNLDPNPRQVPNPNPRQNPNPNPNPRQSNYMPAHQLQESSLFLPNQPLVWAPHNQPPFGFPGYGGQWGPNYMPTQSPGYNYMDVLVLAGLVALCYQQR